MSLSYRNTALDTTLDQHNIVLTQLLHIDIRIHCSLALTIRNPKANNTVDWLIKLLHSKSYVRGESWLANSTGVLLCRTVATLSIKSRLAQKSLAKNSDPVNTETDDRDSFRRRVAICTIF